MKIGQFINTMKQARYGILEIVEGVLALVMFFAVLYFSFNTGGSFLYKDWSSTSVMNEFISFILLVLLGFELIRLILVHSITVVMELMLLIIARKMLYPEIVALDLLYCVVAFLLTVGIYYFYELKPLKSLEDITK
jgi:hypothetical protein